MGNIRRVRVRVIEVVRKKVVVVMRKMGRYMHLRILKVTDEAEGREKVK